MTSFLQSDQWMEFQKSLGRKVFDVNGAKIIKHPLPFGKSWLYMPYVDSMTNDELRMTNQLANDHKSIFVKIEPLDHELAQALVHQGYTKSRNVQPHKTVVLDLTLSEEELLGKMHHKTRYNIKIAQKNNIKIQQEKNIDIFWGLMQKTTARDKFSSYSKEYYAKLLQFCDLYIAYKDSRPLAAAIVATHDNVGYYLHGASDYVYRNLMAPYLLHWEIVRALKLYSSKAIRLYDLWGIDVQKWPGVTRFKLGWGGRTVEYPGAFDLVFSKPWYTLYHAYHILRRRG